MRAGHGHVTGQAWHALEIRDVLGELEVDARTGLSAAQARQRLARVGPNAVGEHRETSLWQLFLVQFRSLLLLLGTSAVPCGADGVPVPQPARRVPSVPWSRLGKCPWERRRGMACRMHRD